MSVTIDKNGLMQVTADGDTDLLLEGVTFADLNGEVNAVRAKLMALGWDSVKVCGMPRAPVVVIVGPVYSGKSVLAGRIAGKGVGTHQGTTLEQVMNGIDRATIQGAPVVVLEEVRLTLKLRELLVSYVRYPGWKCTLPGYNGKILPARPLVVLCVNDEAALGDTRWVRQTSGKLHLPMGTVKDELERLALVIRLRQRDMPQAAAIES